MRIVFFGSPAAALPSLAALLDGGHEIALVVTQPDRPAGRGRRLTPSAVKAMALERRIPVLEPVRIRTDAAAAERIRAAAADVHVVVAYGQIIPHEVHFPPRYHSLNVHFSLLPEYRGAAPVQWTVLHGDAESGVTIIELNDRMDEGDILARQRVAVGPEETAGELERRLAVLGARLLVSTLGRIDSVPHLKQDEARATLAPKIRKEDGLIVWTAAAREIAQRVRALGERPGAYTLFKGKRVNILRGSQVPAVFGSYVPPGRIIEVNTSGLAVACGCGSVYLIQELQPEGRCVMPAYAFSLGARIAPGDVLGI